MSQTLADNFLPSATGYDLGSATQQWDAHIQNLNVYGAITLSSPAIVGMGVVYPAAYGAVGDGRAVTHAVATASNTTLVDTTDSPWVPADVGKTIVIYSQTYSPGLVTTISSVTDSAHIVLAAAPSLSGTVNAVWGTDDSAAIASAVAAITATGNYNHLHFPAGIYLVSSPMVFTNNQGLVISGAGAASALSLGNYNVTPQPATGTALVWAGTQGGTTGDVSENVMLQVSGQFQLRDITFIGSQLVSHCVQVGGTASSVSFDWSLDRVNISYARQWGLVLGGTGADQGGNYGESSVSNCFLAGNGIPNTTEAESSFVGGGDVFVRYGTGNFQVGLHGCFFGGGSGVNGNHHVYVKSGNMVSLDSFCYCAPLTANSTSHSSVYLAAGLSFTFRDYYDENGYWLNNAGVLYISADNVQLRQQVTTNPHFGATTTNTPAISLNNVFTDGLPLVFTAGAKMSRNKVSYGSLSTPPAYGKTLSAVAGSTSRSGATVTFTTTTAHGYATNDWVEVNNVDDATYNGVFKITGTPLTTTFTVTNAAAVGASTQNGTVGLASGIVAETATAYNPQQGSPFIHYLDGGSGAASLANVLYADCTNIAHKNAITVIQGSVGGAAGSSFPATIPAAWHFMDLRGSQVTLLGGPYVFGTAANNVAVTINGTLAMGTGAITPVSTAGIVGTTTNNNANAGSIGEVATATVATGSSVSLTTNTTANVTSVSLTAGDWEVWGVVDFTFAATTSFTNLSYGISTTSATLGSQDTYGQFSTAANVPTAAHDPAFLTPRVRISIAGTTTVYLVAQGTFTVDTLKAYGTIRARRVR